MRIEAPNFSASGASACEDAKRLITSASEERKMQKDLTVGSPDKVLWKFCLPLFGSIIFQQLYNIADSLVAGKFIGDSALAAVGNSYEVTLIFIAFAFGTNIGCSVVVSALFGAKKFGEMKTAVYTTFISGACLCLALMLIGYFCSPYLLKLINTPESVFADCELYLNIYVFGLPFLLFYNVATGIFSAMGDSVTPFIFLACSSVANVVMDVVFVVVLKMGVAGVAWATFICQGVSCVLALTVVLIRLKKIKTEEKVKIFSFGALRSVARIAVPSILQQSFVSVGNIIVQGLINSFGEAVMAGYSAAIKLNNLVVTSFVTLGNGVSNFTAQNLGAGKPERVPKGYVAGLKLLFVIAIPICALYLGAGKYLLMLFMKEGGAALDEGLTILRILSPFYLVVATKIVTDGILRGAGKMWQFMVTTFSDMILRVAVAFILTAIMKKSLGIWLAWPIGWGVATAVSLILYKIYRPKTANVEGTATVVSDDSK